MHKYQFYATDGQFAKFTILKNNPLVFNTPPKIITNNNIKATEDTYYKVYYEYEDMDVENVDQVIKWNFSSNANWLKFNPSTAILNGTPTNEDVGKYWVNITISDTMNFNFSNFTLTVINVNDAPIIITNKHSI